MSEWIEITDDPATLPEMGKTVVVCMDADSGGGEEFAFLDFVINTVLETHCDDTD